MPLKRRVAKGRIQGLTEMQRLYFLDEITVHEALDRLKPQGDQWEDSPEFQEYMTFFQMLWPEVSGVTTERQLWERHRDELLADYVRHHPGERPRIWWEHDAPRVSDEQLREWGFREEHHFFSAERWEERPCEPRQLLGGIGTAAHEVLAHLPAFSYGIPGPWITRQQVDYYSGRAKDIHGQPIGTEYKNRPFKGRAIDPHNPPIFESQAAYLKRHRLFLAGEERRLTPADFEPTLILLDADGQDPLQRVHEPLRSSEGGI